MPATVASRSSWADRKFGRIAGSLPGVADLMWIEPMLSERSTFTFMVMPLRAETRRSLPIIS